MTSEQDALLEEAFNGEGGEDGYDLSGVEEQSFEALPAGQYLATVIETKLEKVKSGDNKGAPKFVIRFKLEGTNKPIFKHAILTGKSAGWTKGFLKKLGVDVTEKITPSVITGKTAVLTLKVREDRPGDNDIVDLDSSAEAIAGASGESTEGLK